MQNKLNKKTSELQKKILVLIYLKGKGEDLVSVCESIPGRVDVQFQLEKQKLVDERKGKLWHESRDSQGLLTHEYKIQSHMLFRSKLACYLFSWQKFNQYKESWREASFRAKPDKYHARQTALTNSLKSLKNKGYIEFRDFYENQLEEFNKKQARVVWLTTEGIRKAESILTIKSNQAFWNLIVREQ